MTTVTYVSRNAPRFSMRIPTDEGNFKLQFENKHCALDDADPIEHQVIEILDGLIAKRSDLSSQLTKVDREAALEIAAAHKAAQPVQSHTGPTTSMHNPAFASQLEQRGRELRSQGVSEDDVQKQLDQMKTELQLTAPSTEVVRDPSGFIPNPTPSAPAPVEVVTEPPAPETADPKAVFNLGSKAG